MYQHHNSMAFNTKRSNEHLQIWLKTRQLLLNEFQQGTPDQQLLESNKEAILDGFGDFHVILNCLIDNANKEQLTNIHRTLEDVRLNTPKPTLHRSVCHEYDNDKDIDFEGFDLDEARVDSYCCFNELSFVEISCIIDFLPPYCAQRFKNTSRKIAIVVLQEMNKRKVNIFSMNKLMDYECKDVYQLGIATYSSSSRYPQSMTYSTLTDLWSKAYNIPHQNMLIYTRKGYNNTLSLLDMQNEANVHSSRHVFHVLFDTRRITVITSSVSNLSVSKIRPNECGLIILKYFDVINQRLDIVDVLLIDANVSVFKLCEYIQTNTRQTYSAFQSQWKAINRFNLTEYHSKLEIYHETSNESVFNESSNEKILECLSNNNILVFQLNGNHPYINQHKRETENTSLDKVYTDVISFRIDYQKRKVYYEKMTDDDDQYSYRPYSWNNHVLVGGSWTFGLIRKNIAKQLTVEPKCLELYKTDTDTNQLERIYDDDTIKYNDSVRWRLADYDARRIVRGQRVYRLELWRSQASGFKALKCTRDPIWFRYLNQFTVKDFVNYIKSNGYLADKMDQYLPFVCANNNILSSYSRCYTMNETFDANHSLLSVDNDGRMVVDLKLFIMQNTEINNVNNNHNSNQCLLRIRFTHNTVHGSAYYKSTAKLIGIPYVVACRRGDDLQSVMNRADFDSWIRKNIGTCYVYVESPNSRFGTNLARKSGSYSHLEVFQSIMRGDIHECLVIKLKKQFPE